MDEDKLLLAKAALPAPRHITKDKEEFEAAMRLRDALKVKLK